MPRVYSNGFTAWFATFTSFTSPALVSVFKDDLFFIFTETLSRVLGRTRRASLYKLQASGNSIPEQISGLHSSSDSLCSR